MSIKKGGQKMKKYFVVVSWADAQFIGDNLNSKKIPFALYVVSGVNVRIEIDAGCIDAARSIGDWIRWEAAQ
jgi:hypothetical protein